MASLQYPYPGIAPGGGKGRRRSSRPSASGGGLGTGSGMTFGISRVTAAGPAAIRGSCSTPSDAESDSPPSEAEFSAAAFGRLPSASCKTLLQVQQSFAGEGRGCFAG